MDLTDTQREILAFLAERIEADGFAPSQSEISRAFGFKGVRGAQYHLEALEAAGAIERRPGQARSLRVLTPPPSAQAGLPLELEEITLTPSDDLVTLVKKSMELAAESGTGEQ